VGNLLLLNESGDPSVPKMPLDVLVAQTEGSLGYFLQQAMLNEMQRRGKSKYVMTVVSQVVVSPADPAFKAPNKPIGPFLTQEEAEKRRDTLGWIISEDPGGRGWRRLVPSPSPIKVAQWRMIRESAEAGHIVIACGGGGVPVIVREDGAFAGVEAVIDKDSTSSILATQIGAEILIILTEVPNIYTSFNTEHQKTVSAITIEELRALYEKGEFPKGSMGPKVKAAIDFLDNGGKRVIVTNPKSLSDALTGSGGTHVIGAC
jgi:carbamate kinase